MRIGIPLVLAALAATAIAQGPPHNGPRPVDPGYYALVHAQVVPSPGQQLADATIVLRYGRIVAVEAAATPPAGATVVDCTGLTIYPGLIEPFCATDVPALPEDQTDQHWNPMVQAQRNALDGALVDEKTREQLRGLGFAVAAAVPSGGILKGTSTVVLLDEPDETSRPRVVRDRAFAAASLTTARGGYPNSEMGAIAVLRQLLADGRWYDRCRRTIENRPELGADAPQPSRVLAAIADQWTLPLWFDTQNELQALRALKVANEFERTAVVVGSGMEFRRLEALAERGAAMVVPLHLPDAPDVSTAADADDVTLRQLQSWEHAPSNSRRLLDRGLTVAWTTARLPERKAFAARVRDAIAAGVTVDEALAAMTTTPAKLLGIERWCGTIAPGKLANLVVCDGELFDEEGVVRDVWVGGVRHVVAEATDLGLDGNWTWATGWPGDAAGAPATLAIDGKKVTLQRGEDKLEASGSERTASTMTCRLQGEALGDGVLWLRLHRAEAGLSGELTSADGQRFPVTLRAAQDADEPGDEEPAADAESAAESDSAATAAQLKPLPTPLGGFGFARLPQPTATAITNATLWTCDGRGIVQGGAIYMRDGKIVFAGPMDEMPQLPDDVQVLDAEGRHVTPGIIDCHSHTGISRGVNESGQAVTSEVRIQDVLDPDDVNWYRQLAGGVTAVNQLHGSANVIGGQSNTVKVRYGVARPDDMFFANSKPGIKFALGENPRRVNGRGDNSRYPNTRMGVEGLLRDRFAAAEAYAAEQAAYRAQSAEKRARELPPRVDYELEALAEVLAGARWIHCHSYRQDEIFMLCGLADAYGIKIGTFQHVLEGYKVADAIKRSAVGASSFSDWWAYKLEVYDAIPDNGAILHEQGVVTSFNSDSNEHARRLNTEAGKAVKYGGVAPAEALCFVTRNPAIQLGVFARTGSLTRGKDADVAMWSADPLSYRAVCQRTWVDGREMFSLERDAVLRDHVRKERARLIQLALAKGKGKGSKRGDPRDAYWAAEELDADYCCRNAEGGQR